MSGVSITGLNPASTLTGSEIVPIVQSGTTVRTTLAAMPYVPAGTGAVTTTVQTKLREIVNVDDFIPVGTTTFSTNCQSYIQAAFDYAATIRTRVSFSKGTYKVDSGLTLDISTTGIEGNDAVLDFSAMTSGTALSFTQSNSDANWRTAYNHVNSFDHLFFIGPGANYSSAVAVVINDAASPYTLAGGSFNHCSFMNWGIDVEQQNGAFCWTFNKCAFTVTSGVPTTSSLTFAMLTNNGERNTFIDCFWYNRKYVLDQSNGNGDTIFIGCSIDGAARSFTVTGGRIYLIGCHIEYVDDTDYWFYVSGQNTLLSFESCEIVSQSAKTAYSPFYCDSTCTVGGIQLQNCYFSIVLAMTVPFINGTGRTFVKNINCLEVSARPASVSDSQNYLAYGGFESSNYTAEWTLANGAVRSSAQAKTGTYSLSLPATGGTGVIPSASMTMPISPGQQVFGSLYYKVLNITGTSGTFYIEINYLDKGNNSLSGAALLSTTVNVTDWTLIKLNFLTPAPKGTVSYSVSISLFGASSGTPTGYIDDVNVCAV